MLLSLGQMSHTIKTGHKDALDVLLVTCKTDALIISFYTEKITIKSLSSYQQVL